MQVIELSNNRKTRPKSVGWGSLDLSASVIAFDPGGTTGWSLISVSPGALVKPEVHIEHYVQKHIHGQISCDRGPNAEFYGIQDCISLIDSWPGAFVIMEDFVILQMNKSREFLTSTRINAATEQHLWQHRRNYCYQMPHERVTATDARLKAWGLYDPYGGNDFRHMRDADRHAIVFLRKASALTMKGHEMRVAAWPHLYSEGQPYAPGTKFGPSVDSVTPRRKKAASG